jgi:hypothetical protein
VKAPGGRESFHGECTDGLFGVEKGRTEAALL